MSRSVDLKRIAASLGMPMGRYALLIALPIVGATVAVALVLRFALGSVFHGPVAMVPWGIPVMALLFVLVHPVSVAHRRRHVMDHSMHYFITHMGVLATSRVPRVELFRMLGSKRDEYGPLADECANIATLVQKWNMSLAEACRFVAQRTPSLLFSDFLERFAFGIESGAEIEAYLKAEQAVVMADYETLYKKTLYNIESIKQMFNGMMMTVIFVAMFALMMPVLVGGSTALVMWGLVLGTLFVEGAFLALVHAKVPPDPVWVVGAPRSPLGERLKISLPVAAASTLLLAAVLFAFTAIPPPIALAMAATPLLVPGYMATRAEMMVKRRDDNYPAFIRSLGASTSARGGDARDVLRHLRWHDFGPLTNNIRDLFARLQMRVDDAQAWRYFTGDAGSRLIQRFMKMYEESIQAGGRPDDSGQIISDNMVRIVGLRKLRYQEASSFRGTLFAIGAGIAFSLFIGIGVLGMLAGLFSSLTMHQDLPINVPTIIHVESLDLPLAQALSLILLIVNAGASAIMVRLVDGGALARGLEDFTIILWVSNVTAWVSAGVIGRVVGGNVVDVGAAGA